MNLLARRIPYSFIYTKPGEPSVRMTATASALVEVGKKIDVKVRMEKADKSPVLLADLIEMHTQPIHLLIEEVGLGDYHHEHPVPTQIPGEYAFSFIPAKTAPYRVWADIVPAATGVQELPFVDLLSTGKAETIADTENRFTSAAGSYRLALTFTDGNQLPAKAGQARNMAIAVSDSDGKPVTTLEPVMNAFAHLVGFYDEQNGRSPAPGGRRYSESRTAWRACARLHFLSVEGWLHPALQPGEDRREDALRPIQSECGAVITW